MEIKGTRLPQLRSRYMDIKYCCHGRSWKERCKTARNQVGRSVMRLDMDPRAIRRGLAMPSPKRPYWHIDDFELKVTENSRQRMNLFSSHVGQRNKSIFLKGLPFRVEMRRKKIGKIWFLRPSADDALGLEEMYQQAFSSPRCFHRAKGRGSTTIPGVRKVGNKGTCDCLFFHFLVEQWVQKYNESLWKGHRI